MKKRTQFSGTTRQGFTLIELLVVISIMVVLIGLAVFLAPNFGRNEGSANGTSKLQSSLMIAKQQALRDRGLYGIRLIPSTVASGWATEFQYVSQPAPVAPRKGFPNALSIRITKAAPTTVQLVDTSAGNAAVSWQDQGVLPSDILEISDGNGVFIAISGVSGNLLTLSQPVPGAATADVNYNEFQVHRQPRPVAGEENIQLPGGIGVDLTKCSPSAADIVFTPAGGISGASTGKIILWVDDMDKAPSGTSKPYLIAIFTRTGFIGTYEVAPGADPFAYVKDGRSSGQ